MTEVLRREIEALRDLSDPELVKRYEQLFGQRPRSRNRKLIWRRCAWKLQEERLGGLSGLARRRLDALIAQIDLGSEQGKQRVLAPSRPRGSPPVGTVFTRVWRGQEIQVEVTATGFEWNGQSYRSLSAVARAVTGAHWNGRLFFGLTQRKRRKPS